MKFIVNENVFNKLPEVCFGIVIAKGVDNKNPNKRINELLDANIKQSMKEIGSIKVKEYEKILPYRKAFTELGINPNKFMCSIEALMTRIMKGGQFPSINNIVNISNAISVKYILPLGAHDIDRSTDDFVIRFSEPGYTFIPFGTNEPEIVDPGELVYSRGKSIKTRKWIWRQSEEGKITEESRNIFFPIDGFRDANYKSLISARDELGDLVREIFGAKVQLGYVDKSNNIFNWE